MSTLSETGALRGRTRTGGFVLIVAPEGQETTTLTDVLRGAGFEVIATPDPAEAVRVSQDRRPDLTVVDGSQVDKLAGIEQWSTVAVLLSRLASSSIGRNSVSQKSEHVDAKTENMLLSGLHAPPDRIVSSAVR